MPALVKNTELLAFVHNLVKDASDTHKVKALDQKGIIRITGYAIEYDSGFKIRKCDSNLILNAPRFSVLL